MTLRQLIFSSTFLSLVFMVTGLTNSLSPRVHAGLVINLEDLGENPENDQDRPAPAASGTGNLQYIMEAAAQVWEQTFNSSSFDHTLDVKYYWGDLGSTNVLATHFPLLFEEVGDPKREIEAGIIFNSTITSFFIDGSLDPMNPLSNGNTEYGSLVETTADYGGGDLNNGRSFTASSGDAFDRHDLFTIALHEIGHALGMSSGSMAYINETSIDSDIDIGGGVSLPVVGSQLPVYEDSAHLEIPTALLSPFIGRGVRKLPSDADIIANAQISQFPNSNLGVSAVPEPSMFIAFLLIGLSKVHSRPRRTL